MDSDGQMKKCKTLFYFLEKLSFLRSLLITLLSRRNNSSYFEALVSGLFNTQLKPNAKTTYHPAKVNSRDVKVKFCLSIFGKNHESMLPSLITCSVAYIYEGICLELGRKFNLHAHHTNGSSSEKMY